MVVSRVHEHRRRPRVHHRVDRADEGEVGAEHIVVAPHAEDEEGDVQCSCPCRAGDGVLRAHPLAANSSSNWLTNGPTEDTNPDSTARVTYSTSRGPMFGTASGMVPAAPRAPGAWALGRGRLTGGTGRPYAGRRAAQPLGGPRQPLFEVDGGPPSQSAAARPGRRAGPAPPMPQGGSARTRSRCRHRTHDERHRSTISPTETVRPVPSWTWPRVRHSPRPPEGIRLRCP